MLAGDANPCTGRAHSGGLRSVELDDWTQHLRDQLPTLASELLARGAKGVPRWVPAGRRRRPHRVHREQRDGRARLQRRDDRQVHRAVMASCGSPLRSAWGRAAQGNAAQRSRQGALQRPAARDSVPQRVRGDAVLFRKLSQRASLTIPHDVLGAATVSLLRLNRNPSAISGLVSSRVVCAVQLMPSRAWPHVREKHGETFSPALAHLNPARAVAGIVTARRAVAAGNHRPPHSIETSALRHVVPSFPESRDSAGSATRASVTARLLRSRSDAPR